jgi:hypothetical protein
MNVAEIAAQIRERRAECERAAGSLDRLPSVVESRSEDFDLLGTKGWFESTGT